MCITPGNWIIWHVPRLGKRAKRVSYLIPIPKDPFALKPLLFAETDTFVAVANEEIAIRSAFEGTYEVREAQAKEVRVWQR